MKLDSLILDKPHHSANSSSAAVVANWHDENHPGAYAMCQEQPCAAVRQVDMGGSAD